jgi:hypothetical protein
MGPVIVTRAYRLSSALAVALLLSLLGCANPFQPADPEPPSGDAVIEDFGTIDDLLNTMAIAIQTRPNGADAYLHAFAESTTAGQRAYRGYHDPAAKAAWLAGSGGQTAPEPWTLQLERTLHSQLSGIRQNDPYFFQWSSGPPPGYPNDEEIATDVWSVHRKYQLYATPNNGEPALIASGFADLLIQNEGSRYSIFEWRDRVDPDFGVNPPADERSFTYYRLESQ